MKSNTAVLITCNGKGQSNGLCDTCFQPMQTTSINCGRLIEVVAPSEEVKQGVDAMMKTLEDRENAFIQAYNFLHEDDEDCPKLTSESLGDSDFEDEMDLCELYYQIRTGKIKF